MDYIAALQNLGFGVVEEMVASACKNYKVERNGKYYTAKIADRSEPSSYFQIVKEQACLSNLRGIPNIVNAKDFYFGETELLMFPKSTFTEALIRPDLITIIKEFIPGETLENQKLKRTQKKILYDTVFSIHKRGICNLDLNPSNVVISEKDKQPYLFDFGLCFSKKFIDDFTFKDLTMHDINDLNKL